MISCPDGRQRNRSKKQRLNERRPLMMELYLFREEVGGKAHGASRGSGTTDSGKVNERRDSTLETRGGPELEEKEERTEGEGGTREERRRKGEKEEGTRRKRRVEWME